MHRCRPEVDCVPTEVANLGSPEAMPVGEQDHGGVAVAVAVAFGRLDQRLDLSLGQVFPLPVIGIGPSAGRRWNCSLFSG